MPNELSGLHWVRDWWPAIVVGAGIVGLAALYKLRGVFATRRSLHRLGEDFSRREKDIRDELKRVEALVLGAHDMIGRNAESTIRMTAEVNELREYGSDPVRILVERLHALDKKLGVVLAHLEILRGRSITMPYQQHTDD